MECDSRGIDARPDRCQSADVKAYPTWVVEGARREGVLSLDELAELSRFRRESGTPGS